MSKEIRKAEDLQIGKCYKIGNTAFIKVEDELKDGEHKFGSYIKILDWKVLVERECIFFDLDIEGDHSYSEITQEEFEQKLQKAQEEFVKIINQVKNNDNEETTA